MKLQLKIFYLYIIINLFIFLIIKTIYFNFKNKNILFNLY